MGETGEAAAAHTVGVEAVGGQVADDRLVAADLRRLVPLVTHSTQITTRCLDTQTE